MIYCYQKVAHATTNKPQIADEDERLILMKDFKIELDVAEFHHIFKSLVDARYRNENEMKSLVKDDFFVDEEILDENRYNQLKQENEEITKLIN